MDCVAAISAVFRSAIDSIGEPLLSSRMMPDMEAASKDQTHCLSISFIDHFHRHAGFPVLCMVCSFLA
jgi:hypothetical protein